ncbi:hypothetical protein L7F22_012283 [Adiantum nelumboides]|nr:hypothetical protein [Adiantum nelumboides]
MAIVDGTFVCPAPTAPTHADWMAKDLKARLEMLLHMEDAQTQTVRTLTTAKAIWDYLIATYERKNKASQVNLYKKLNTLIMEEDGEADKFIRLWRLAMDDLIISGLVLSDEFQAVLLLAALPPSWQPFITTKTNLPNLTLPILIPSILEEYEMRRTIVPNASSTSTNIAMYSRNMPSRGRKFGPSSTRTQFQGLSLRALQTDNGGEYTSHIFQSYCQQHGIRQRLTVPHNPKQNGIAERMNRSLMNMARSMLKIASLPPSFWEEAVATSCYLQNRVYTRSTNNIPYTLWYGQKPDFAILRIFGCTAYAHVPPTQRHKLSDHAIKAIFVGYGEPYGIKGYRLYDIGKRNFFYSRSLIFDEDSLLSVAAAGPRVAASSTPSMSSKAITKSTGSWRAPPDPAPALAARAAPLVPAQAPNPPFIPVAAAPPVQPATPNVSSRTSASHGTARHTRSFTRLDYRDSTAVAPSHPQWDPTGPRSVRKLPTSLAAGPSSTSRKKTTYKPLAIQWDSLNQEPASPPIESQPVSSAEPPSLDCPNTWPNLPNASPSTTSSSTPPQPQQRTRSLADIYKESDSPLANLVSSFDDNNFKKRLCLHFT